MCFLAGVDPTDARAAAAVPPVPPIDSINMWPFLSGAVSTSPRDLIPVGSNCLVQGDWKLILGRSSPDFWQGPKYPNSSSAALMHPREDAAAAARAETDAVLGSLDLNGVIYGDPTDKHWASEVPVRGFPKLEPCSANKAVYGDNSATQWVWQSTSGNVCSVNTTKLGRYSCWNVQKSMARLILWPEASSSNAQFKLTDGAITVGSGGCVGSAGSGQPLVIVNCMDSQHITSGWSYNSSTREVQVADPSGTGEMLCVVGDPNGTSPVPPGPPNPPTSGYLFNVARDPTEQNNLFASDPDRVANMTKVLTELQATFFRNHDTFKNDCPNVLDANISACACTMAKTRYGGFMGPYAMLNMDMTGRGTRRRLLHAS